MQSPAHPRPAPAALRPALILDRDGVLIADSGYVHRPAQAAWIAGAFDAVRHANAQGWYVFVATNQSGVARGLYDEASLRDFHRWMAAEMARRGARIDAFAYCPHHPLALLPRYRLHCRCRKPAPGMITALCAAWPVDRACSLLIGDRETDLAAAHAAGIAGHRFAGGDLAAFVRDILGRNDNDAAPAGGAAAP